MTDSLRDYDLTPADRRCLEMMGDFIPQKVFDAHAHLFDMAFLPGQAADGLFAKAGPVAGREAYMKWQAPLYGEGREVRINVISMPDAAMAAPESTLREQCTAFLARYLAEHPQDVGEVLVLPADTPDDVRALLVHPNIRGFKCYHVNAASKPTWSAGIGEYLPESAWQVAHEKGLYITLHMVRDHALADEGNKQYIADMAKKYPNARLILAHAARAFAGWTVMEGIDAVVGLPNVYFDVSAICEPAPMAWLLKKAGAKRVLWGSDFPVSMQRGKAISIADSFLWLDGKMLEQAQSNTAFSVALTGTENLMALWQACRLFDVDTAGVEDIFYNNAVRLFAL